MKKHRICCLIFVSLTKALKMIACMANVTVTSSSTHAFLALICINVSIVQMYQKAALGRVALVKHIWLFYIKSGFDSSLKNS